MEDDSSTRAIGPDRRVYTDYRYRKPKCTCGFQAISHDDMDDHIVAMMRVEQDPSVQHMEWEG